MTPTEFAYWLQGLFELGRPTSLDARQTEMIKAHLALVFTNVTAQPVKPLESNEVDLDDMSTFPKDLSSRVDELQKRLRVKGRRLVQEPTCSVASGKIC